MVITLNILTNLSSLVVTLVSSYYNKGEHKYFIYDYNVNMNSNAIYLICLDAEIIALSCHINLQMCVTTIYKTILFTAAVCNTMFE